MAASVDATGRALGFATVGLLDTQVWQLSKMKSTTATATVVATAEDAKVVAWEAAVEAI